jgi:hypothetical protein
MDRTDRLRTRSMLRPLFVFAGVAALLVSTPSTAGDKAPLSSLPTIPMARERTEPESYGVPGLAVKEVRSGSREILELTALARRGYCIVDRERSMGLSASTALWGDEKPDQKELWHLVENDGKATLEQTRLMMVPSQKNAWALSTSSVELREVARSNGVTVWAYRDRTGDAVLLARGAFSGREVRAKQEETGFTFVSSDCGFGAVRLDATSAKAGAIAQLRGSLPPVGTGKDKVVPQFVVNGSLAKLARDPEPLLAVRVQLTD